MPGGGHQHRDRRAGRFSNSHSNHDYPILPRLATLRRSDMFQTTYRPPVTPRMSYNASQTELSNNNGQSNINAVSSTTQPRNDRPGRRDRGHQGNRRSHSPVDRRDSNAARRHRPALPRELEEQDKFQDPYVEHDRLRGRRGRQAEVAYQGVEFKWSPAGLQPTPLATATQHLIDLLKASKLGARDINGAMFRSMPEGEIKILAQNWNVISAHIFGRLYDERYKGYRNEASKIMTNLEPGVVITCPITERMMDDGISLDNLERGNGLHGSTLTKHRTNVVCKVLVNERKIEVRPCYGFHGNGPPEAHKEGYVRLIHLHDSSAHVDENGYQLIHYTGNNHLMRRSYFRIGEPVWISVDKTPCSIEGSLIVDDYKRLGDLIGLSDAHPFAKKGQMLRNAREMANGGK